MTVWALADLHLAFGVPEKTMDVFGEPWIGYMQKIKLHWESSVSADDLVLLPGDISWGMHPREAKADLDFIHALPGTKVMLRGNHDYWWTSLKQIKEILPPSIHLIQNNAFAWKNCVIGGARLWDTAEYNFEQYVNFTPNPRSKKLEERDFSDDAEKIFLRELGRLELSLKEMNRFPGIKIVMTHYPPISADLQDSRVSTLLEKNNIKCCVFGHLHNVKHGIPLFGEKNGVKYIYAAADYLDFNPLRILS
jgi:predicted phosphohydrolase